jgi:hypothetical protein
LAAEVSCAQDLTPRLVSDETIRVALHRLRVSWKRATHWMTNPDLAYLRKKRRDRLIQRAVVLITVWRPISKRCTLEQKIEERTHELARSVVTFPTDENNPETALLHQLVQTLTQMATQGN